MMMTIVTKISKMIIISLKHSTDACLMLLMIMKYPRWLAISCGRFSCNRTSSIIVMMIIDNDNDNNDDNDNNNDDNNLLWQVSLQPDGTYKTESRLSFIATRWTFGLSWHSRECVVDFDDYIELCNVICYKTVCHKHSNSGLRTTGECSVKGRTMCWSSIRRNLWGRTLVFRSVLRSAVAFLLIKSVTLFHFIHDLLSMNGEKVLS